MMHIKCILTTAFIAFALTVNAQKPDDLGSTKPFMVGLKGTIYPFQIPKNRKNDRFGYHDSIERMKPIGYVYTQSLNISERELTQPFPGVPRGVTVFSIIYTGRFEVKETTNYEFVLKSDDGSRLWIDTTSVINHDGLRQFHMVGKGKIALKKGFHNLKVWYFQGYPTRMGLLLLMKKQADSTWLPFDLKPMEDEIKQIVRVDSGVAKAQLNERFLFDVAKSDVKPEAEAQLANIAKLLNIYPNATLKIDGHTDNKGAANANQLLSENRAIAIVEALKNIGIPETIAVETKGFGAKQPIVPNNSEENRAKNRRVEISISTE